MKLIDRYILKSFILPFCAAFFVVLLIFVLQILWLYADDIVGKGIGAWTIVQMMVYLSASMVPMALPVSILLASIMTFGNLSENSELTALKAAGFPLFRIMLSLIALMLLISYGAFVFSNKVIPYANFRSENMLRNIVNKKPALKLEPGVFTSVVDFSIRVGEKIPIEGDKKDSIRDVLIYDLRQHNGTTSVIRAESGSIATSDDNRYMLLTLYNGRMYDEDIPQAYAERLRQPNNKSRFKQQTLPIDISSFTMDDLNSRDQSNRHTMLDIAQLTVALDSMKTQYKERIQSFARSFEFRNGMAALPPDSLLRARVDPARLDTLKPVMDYLSSHNQQIYSRLDVYRNSASKLRESNEELQDSALQLRENASSVNSYGLEIQRKYALAFSVIVLFFIGAPLGALIRKGGIGLPVVVAIGIFTIYNIIFMSGERMGKEGTLDVVTARWLPTWILLPFGIWLTYRATKDMVIINLDPLLNLWDRLWSRVPQKYRDRLKFGKKKKKQ